MVLNDTTHSRHARCLVHRTLGLKHLDACSHSLAIHRSDLAARLVASLAWHFLFPNFRAVPFLSTNYLRKDGFDTALTRPKQAA